MGKSIGETLREGRLHQRLSIAECAKRTHISPRYLEALEEERWGELPSESHRMGFLRLYARFLGVYSEEMIQQYRHVKQGPAEQKHMDVPKVAPARPPEKALRRWNSVTWQRLILVIIFGMVFSW